MRVLRRCIVAGAAIALLISAWQVLRNRKTAAPVDAQIDLVSLVYTPGVIRANGGAPLRELRVLGDAWTKQYELHTSLRFLAIPELGPSAETWSLTRLMGGVAPEIMSAQSRSVFLDRAADWYVDLTPYLAKPNHYVPGNKAWADLFRPGVLEEWRSPYDSRLYCLPIDQVEVAIFYNKEIFKRCGIRESELPPKTWEQFIAVQQRIADAGEVPFLMPGASPLRIRWIYQILFDMLNDDRFEEINVVAARDERSPTIGEQELVRASEKQILSVGDPRYLETWRIIRDWSRLWQKGFLGTSDLIAFQRGRAAMTIDGSWFVSALKNDKQRDFEYGIFLIPPLTKSTSIYASGAPARGVGGAAAVQWCITRETAMRKGNVDACIDALMYLTAPQNCGPMVAEAESFLPAIIGAEVSTDLRFMEPLLALGNVRIDAFDRMTPRARDEWWSTMQYFLEGTYSEADVVRVMRVSVERQMRELLEHHKDDWRWEKNAGGEQLWEIAPDDKSVAVTRSNSGAKVKQ